MLASTVASRKTKLKYPANTSICAVAVGVIRVREKMRKISMKRAHILTKLLNRYYIAMIVLREVHMSGMLFLKIMNTIKPASFLLIL